MRQRSVVLSIGFVLLACFGGPGCDSAGGGTATADTDGGAPDGNGPGDLPGRPDGTAAGDTAPDLVPDTADNPDAAPDLAPADLPAPDQAGPDAAPPDAPADGGTPDAPPADSAPGDALPQDGAAGDTGAGDTAPDGGGEPRLAIAIAGEPPYLVGPVTVLVMAEPAAAFHGVEVLLGDASLGEALTPPFDVTFDSAAFADGPATLNATGVLAADGRRLEASLAVELANHAPLLDVRTPTAGEIVQGSPTAGFVVRPEVTASDGNGLTALTVTVGETVIDLDAGAGTVAVPLPVSGPDFPVPPLELVFTARDTTGAETSVPVAVQPSIVPFSFTVDLGTANGYPNTLRAAPDGSLLFQLGINSSTPGGLLYGFGAPAVAAVPVLAATDRGTPYEVAASDTNAFWLAYENSVNTLFTAPLGGGPLTELRRLVWNDSEQPLWYRPPVDGAGRLLVGWTTHGACTPEGCADVRLHLEGYAPDGTRLFEAPPSEATAGGEPIRLADGRLLVSLALPGEPARLTPLDLATGTWGTPFDAVDGVASWSNAVLVADDALFAIGTRPGAAGITVVTLAAFDPTAGTALWHVVLPAVYWSPEMTLPDAERTADGLRFYLQLGGPVPNGGLFEAGPAGLTNLWGCCDGFVPSLLGHATGARIRYVILNDWQNGTAGLVGLHDDGAPAFDIPLSGPILSGYRVLADQGLALVTAASYEAETATLLVVEPDGQQRYAIELPDAEAPAIREVGGQLLLVYSRAADGVTTLESRVPGDGSLRWRFHDGSSDTPTHAFWKLEPFAPWGLVLLPLQRRVGEGPYGSTYNHFALLGVQP